ncbi:MAG: hypothetical protein MZU84_08640 [Sphingobacterium sp.]|nr:hypothetical protein [Sphingobacterium sp.]
MIDFAAAVPGDRAFLEDMLYEALFIPRERPGPRVRSSTCRGSPITLPAGAAPATSA